MPAICDRDIRAALGDVDALVLKELVRTRANVEEFMQALEFVRGRGRFDFKSYEASQARVQRLVDLLFVAAGADSGNRNRAA
ncbi:MAG TPA: hypothetical protein PKA55_00125 [Rhodoblastus sp.]|nr:hypothetical protein [Rhodoblastus sp.]